MATTNNVYKFSVAFSVNVSGGTTNRTISGLNFRYGSSDTTLGVGDAVGLTAIFETLSSFSTGTISNPRFVIERGVNL